MSLGLHGNRIFHELHRREGWMKRKCKPLSMVVYMEISLGLDIYKFHASLEPLHLLALFVLKSTGKPIECIYKAGEI
jgi:hypothetical protein